MTYDVSSFNMDNEIENRIPLSTEIEWPIRFAQLINLEKMTISLELNELGVAFELQWKKHIFQHSFSQNISISTR